MNSQQKIEERLLDLTQEVENLHEIAAHLKPSPGEVPRLPGIDVYGDSVPLNGVIGGDHIIYLDFKCRYDLEARIARAEEAGYQRVAENLRLCREKAAIAVADVSGHRITDALLALMLHQAFLVGASYELDFAGELTSRLIETLNKRFYQSSSLNKYVTLLVGEIVQDGRFRFISAGHQLPVVFSRQSDRIVSISEEHLTTFPPIGTIPPGDDIDRLATQATPLGYKDSYQVNEIALMGDGDIMLLYTDGLSEHENAAGEPYFPAHLETCLSKEKDRSAREIFDAIQEDLVAFGTPHDDVTLVVIKRS